MIPYAKQLYSADSKNDYSQMLIDNEYEIRRKYLYHVAGYPIASSFRGFQRTPHFL